MPIRNQSTKARRSSKANGKPAKPSKPHLDFSLFAHATGRWSKKVKGRFVYFGPWDDPQGALSKWLREKDDLLAGRRPRRSGDGLTISELCNRFLTAKKLQVDTVEIVPRSFADYKVFTDRIVRVAGLSRLVEDLGSDDFEKLKRDISKTRGLVALGNEVTRVRVVFKYAFDVGLIDRPSDYFERSVTAMDRRCSRPTRSGLC